MLDVNMPIMDGKETARRIKLMIEEGQINRAICIANSAFSDSDTKLKCYEAGMDYYFTKPIMIKDFCSLIDSLFPLEK